MLGLKDLSDKSSGFGKCAARLVHDVEYDVLPILILTNDVYGDTLRFLSMYVS